MNKVTKGTPVSSKISAQEAPVADLAELNFDDQLVVDPKIKAELTSKNLAYRWISAAKFKANYGFDARQWQPYKKTEVNENNSFGYADPEGFIRRGDLILAVRPMSVHNAYKQKNTNKINNLAGSAKRSAVDGIKQSFKEAGLGRESKVIEGYDENE